MKALEENKFSPRSPSQFCGDGAYVYLAHVSNWPGAPPDRVYLSDYDAF